MLFTQHIPEIVGSDLWAGQFFIARRNPLIKVIVRRRGKPQVDSSGVFGEWKDRASFGDEGGLRGGAVHPAIDGTLPRDNNWRFAMKMVKSLLLGSAAGLVAVSAGQAAELPVKAKPVEYVKVCNLYGAGFYYMPGTDICLKIGGYARAETTWDSNGNFAAGPTSGDVNNRTTNNMVMRARAYITADAREQTAWGTARTYVAVGVATTDTGATVSPSILGFNRAFIQWAGITAGITQSFYDFYSAAAVGYRAYTPSSDTGDSGWWVWAYTAQLGNGLSVSISAEQRRASQIIGVGQTIAVAPPKSTRTGTSRPRNYNSLDHRYLRQHCDWGQRQYRLLRRPASARHCRQYPARPDLGQRPGHGRVTRRQCDILWHWRQL